MAYKSLYRKYRPNNFSSVCGQKYIIKTLNNCLKLDKIGHAYLFSGSRGTGKTTTAKIFAKMVNCLHPIDNMPCGKCDICTNVNTDEIPDIIEIDAASNNGVDEIRELKNKIKLVPVNCKYKVYIIDEVHMLSTGAFNALLKTLEEPPEHVIFILATTEPQKLPITIISRCQRFDFEKISIEDIKERLNYISTNENISITDDALTEIAKLSDGALRDAIGMLDQLSSYNTDEITIEDIYAIKGSISIEDKMNLVKFYINGDYEQLLVNIDNIYNQGKNFENLSEELLMMFRNILIYRKAPKYFETKEINIKKELIEISNNMSDELLNKTIENFELLNRQIKNSSYPRILFEICMLSNKEIDKVNISAIEDISKERNIEKTNIILKSDTVSQIENNSKKMDKKSDNAAVEINNNIDKDILINNTIYGATAADKKKVEHIFNNLDDFLIDKKLKNAAMILKDATISAASKDHVLFTYKYDTMVNDSDKETINIQKILKKIFDTEYKIVSITSDMWKEKRPMYLEKKKNNTLTYIDEIQSKQVIINKNTSLESDFSDLLEMEG